ncbi:hypothetical protein TNCV_347281 [Trichonephila clavipes]|nr:hypothetical protein TNCV_347281 [Trichonephila clavipes]
MDPKPSNLTTRQKWRNRTRDPWIRKHIPLDKSDHPYPEPVTGLCRYLYRYFAFLIHQKSPLGGTSADEGKRIFEKVWLMSPR